MGAAVKDRLDIIGDAICDARDVGKPVDVRYTFPEFVGPPTPPSELDIEIKGWYCPECDTKLVYVSGIGETCLGPMTCPVEDGILWWLGLSAAERAKARKARIRECRLYKASGNPNFQDLDI